MGGNSQRESVEQHGKPPGYPPAYIDYLAHFHGDRDYFECHEVMEEYWKKDSGSPFTIRWLALIQISVGLYHHRRGNISGALKMIRSAAAHAQEQDWRELGLDGQALYAMLQKRIRLLEHTPSEPYEDLNLPITDPELICMCEQETERMGERWLTPSDEARLDIWEKHLRRDRTLVVQERAKSLEAKRGSRNNNC